MCRSLGGVCEVEKGSRDRVCLTCKRRKRRCSNKGLVNRLVATGGLTTVDEAINFNASSREEIAGLGLERGFELVLLQLFAFQEEMEVRLRAIEQLGLTADT